jgi:hypothetical protein
MTTHFIVEGNVWAQDWSGVYSLTVPYPGKVSIDVTPTMKAKVMFYTTSLCVALINILSIDYRNILSKSLVKYYIIILI